ncbi:fungal-specific transcription factor domain-containing protein [Xylariales sp. PMI_506]|nr:fungal-specific transcription factor domain-containing protein [Xylariales sp. PMI_506]
MRRSVDESEDDEYDDEPRDDDGRRTRNNAAAKSDDGPACQSCRRKKAKCSRDRPCSHCTRYNIDCIYDDKKSKPGLRTGAIENITQRLVTLEKMFLGQGVMWQQVWRRLDRVDPSHQHRLEPGNVCTSASLPEYTAQLRKSFLELQPENGDEVSNEQQYPSPKRRKLDENVNLHQHEVFWMRDGELRLPDDLIDSLVEIYFARIQPWIPILHVRQFPEAMKVPSERHKMRTIFHAIASLCVRFSDDPRLSSPETRSRLAKQCRQSVIIESMESFSVENLQALIICAFDMIGSGRGPSAWSIIGSIARTVEHLQLNIEEEETCPPRSEPQALITRIAFLPPCQDWAAMEGRRRVFWNVFLMDRFCSIATGWNLSLKSAEVRRRLPCEGALWEAGNPLPTPTPYFGIVEEPNAADEDPLGAHVQNGGSSSLGAFSYCIEATESLSLVTNFFLRQTMDARNPQSLRVWLVRFKQLDLRLVQWKTFLPTRWREACARNADGNMDPNLTLAHITHNTAVVLLHQSIAYPSLDWQSSLVRLPSASSAETCLAAAREVAIIADQFLHESGFLTNPQFAFCLFICGRMLLAHSASYNIDLSQEFETLLGSLREISRRWNGPNASDPAQASESNLASKFAYRLFHARQLGPNSLDLRQSAFVENQDQSSGVPRGTPRPTYASTNTDALQQPAIGPGVPTFPKEWRQSAPYSGPPDDASPDSISLAFPPLPMAFQVPSAAQTTMPSPNMDPIESLASQSGIPYDQGPGGFEDLNSFLNYSFLPNQRVSMFSHPMLVEPIEPTEQ